MGRVVQSVACLTADVGLTADPGVGSSIQARSHTFMEIDHLLVSFLASHPKSTAMVITGGSVHLTTLFLGRLEQEVNQYF